MTSPPERTPASKRTISAARPHFVEEDIRTITAAIGDVLRGGRLILGPQSRELEAAFAARVGTKHAISLTSCTAALEIVFRFLNVAGREVIVPTNTFVATANAVRFAGGTPIFADMNQDDYGIDAEDAIARLSDRTAAVVVVHVAGFIPKGLDALTEACRKRSIPIVEDCAHAHGATLNVSRADGTGPSDKEAGSLGYAGCFSFYPTKILTCGVGGMLTTDDDELADYARSLRHHGQGASLEHIERPGNDWVLDEVRSVVALNQFRRLDEFLSVRRAIAARYDELLEDSPPDRGAITLPSPRTDAAPAYYKYPVLIPEGVDRHTLRQAMAREHQIEIGALYSPPCHQMPVFQRDAQARDSSSGATSSGATSSGATSSGATWAAALPVAESILPRQITLPMHAAMTLQDAEQVVQSLRVVLGALSPVQP